MKVIRLESLHGHNRIHLDELYQVWFDVFVQTPAIEMICLLAWRPFHEKRNS